MIYYYYYYYYINKIIIYYYHYICGCDGLQYCKKYSFTNIAIGHLQEEGEEGEEERE